MTEVKPMTSEDMEEMLRMHKLLNPELEVRQDVKDSLSRWIDHGLEPGGFLMAVLRNDLKGALSRADSYNRASLYQIVQYCYAEIPSACWGSSDKVEQWYLSFREGKTEKEIEAMD